jgi:hypothetical protein
VSCGAFRADQAGQRGVHCGWFVKRPLTRPIWYRDDVIGIDGMAHAEQEAEHDDG